MNQFTTDIMQALVLKQDINEIFRVHLENAINQLLELELTGYLDYEKYDRAGFNSGNSRNGLYKRSIKTQYGELHLKIPRDRNGEFKQQTVPPYRRTNDVLENTIVHMFRKGITMSEIADLIEKMYGHHYTPQTISNMTQTVQEEVYAFRTRSLSEQYSCIYLDATYVPVRRGSVSKEAVYIAVGIKADGSKEVLSYSIAPTESAYVWKEVLNDIKERGVKNVQLFISDNLSGIEEMMLQVFPKAKIQTCLVHVARNISHKVKVSDRQEILGDFKKTYQADDQAVALSLLDEFIMKWKSKYPKVMASLSAKLNLFTFFEFPKSIHGSIYSTNLIESFNKMMKRGIKRKEQFPNEESLERFIVSAFISYNAKFSNRCHKGFDMARNELESMFLLSKPS